MLDSSFIQKAITPVFEDSPYYGYGWWLYNFENKKVYSMRGHRGQFVIVIPEDDLIIVRLGDHVTRGTGEEFQGDFYHYIAETYKMLNNS